jgi:hypothetical protein
MKNRSQNVDGFRRSEPHKYVKMLFGKPSVCLWVFYCYIILILCVYLLYVCTDIFLINAWTVTRISFLFGNQEFFSLKGLCLVNMNVAAPKTEPHQMDFTTQNEVYSVKRPRKFWLHFSKLWWLFFKIEVCKCCINKRTWRPKREMPILWKPVLLVERYPTNQECYTDKQ